MDQWTWQIQPQHITPCAHQSRRTQPCAHSCNHHPPVGPATVGRPAAAPRRAAARRCCSQRAACRRWACSWRPDKLRREAGEGEQRRQHRDSGIWGRGRVVVSGGQIGCEAKPGRGSRGVSTGIQGLEGGESSCSWRPDRLRREAEGDKGASTEDHVWWGQELFLGCQIGCSSCPVDPRPCSISWPPPAATPPHLPRFQPPLAPAQRSAPGRHGPQPANPSPIHLHCAKPSCSPATRRNVDISGSSRSPMAPRPRSIS